MMQFWSRQYIVNLRTGRSILDDVGHDWDCRSEDSNYVLWIIYNDTHPQITLRRLFPQSRFRIGHALTDVQTI